MAFLDYFSQYTHSTKPDTPLVLITIHPHSTTHAILPVLISLHPPLPAMALPTFIFIPQTTAWPAPSA